MLLDPPRWRATRALAGRAGLGPHRHGDLGRNALDRRKHPVPRGNRRAKSRPGRPALHRPQRSNLALVTQKQTEEFNAPNFQEIRMYAVTGITGKVGGTVAQTLLAAGEKVRAVVRDEGKGRPWADKGCEVAIASIGDADALTAAFAGADGVFLLTPPNYDPEPGFPQTQANAIAIKKAIVAARPGKVVFLS